MASSMHAKQILVAFTTVVPTRLPAAVKNSVVKVHSSEVPTAALKP